MGTPVLVGSQAASIALDGASFVWSQWRTTGETFGVETWNINCVMGATTATLYLDWAYSANGTVFATSALNNNASIPVGAYFGLTAEAFQPYYYNFHFGATTTIKAFTVVASRAEGSVT